MTVVKFFCFQAKTMGRLKTQKKGQNSRAVGKRLDLQGIEIQSRE
jgi:hypothetical protein